MANLIIDIGNTALKASWADGITLGKTFRYQGEKMLDFILSLVSKSKPDIMVLSSVRTFSPQSVEKLRNECGTLLVLEGKMFDEYDLPSHIHLSVILFSYTFSMYETNPQYPSANLQ